MKIHQTMLLTTQYRCCQITKHSHFRNNVHISIKMKARLGLHTYLFYRLVEKKFVLMTCDKYYDTFLRVKSHIGLSANFPTSRFMYGSFSFISIASRTVRFLQLLSQAKVLASIGWISLSHSRACRAGADFWTRLPSMLDVLGMLV